jgi:hypothetical protein
VTPRQRLTNQLDPIQQILDYFGLGVVPGAGNCCACGLGVVPGAGSCCADGGGVAPGFVVAAGDGAGVAGAGVAGGGVAGFGVAAALFVLFALFDEPRPHESLQDASISSDVIIIETKMNLLICSLPLLQI